MRNVTKRIKGKSSTRGTFYYLPKFRCLGIKSEKDDKGSLEMQVEDERRRKMNATHLIIMVHGIIGSAQDWKYAAEQFLKRYPEDVIAHSSECNASMLTFDGVDVMGERLAEEVIAVRRRHPSAQKISFVAHSLGGLVARYAIGRLYERDPTKDLSQENGEYRSAGVEDAWPENKFKGKIAGLEPINFITLATPHLGSRAHKQVPVFCGFQTLEKVVARFSWCLGKTGTHLFLNDEGNRKPPLLLQMVNDCEDLKFLSALQSFKRRIVYANVRFDYLVGWSTSSLRRKNELPKLAHLPIEEKYPHIVNVETIKPAHPQEEVHLEPKASECKKIDMEEEMIRGLTGMSWERVDVNFSGNIQRILGHSSIQVKNYNMNSDGVDVVQHVVDNFLL